MSGCGGWDAAGGSTACSLHSMQDASPSSYLMAMLPSSVEFVISGACTLPGLPKQVNSCHHDNKEKGKEKLTEVEHPLQTLQDTFPGPKSSAPRWGAHLGRQGQTTGPPTHARDGNQGMIREELKSSQTRSWMCSLPCAGPPFVLRGCPECG